MLGSVNFNCSIGESVVSVVCNASGLAVGNYTLSAYVYPLDSAVCQFGSSVVGGSIWVTYAPDINGDHTVNFFDLLAFSTAYNAYVTYGIYSSGADFNHDGVIDGTDITLFNTAYAAYFT